MVDLFCGDLIASVQSFLDLSSITIDGVQYVPMPDAAVVCFDLFAQAFARIQLVVASSVFGILIVTCGACFFVRFFLRRK